MMTNLKSSSCNTCFLVNTEYTCLYQHKLIARKREILNLLESISCVLTISYEKTARRNQQFYFLYKYGLTLDVA